MYLASTCLYTTLHNRLIVRMHRPPRCPSDSDSSFVAADSGIAARGRRQGRRKAEVSERGGSARLGEPRICARKLGRAVVTRIPAQPGATIHQAAVRGPWPGGQAFCPAGARCPVAPRRALAARRRGLSA